ncbi:MAG: DUF1667 domain-containing protein [Candidatus Marinimicrobia bacterium]|nr:DUF1667 domain-containing protein [Candidatus Neomarinimicrobiota bacterium]
MPGLKRKEMICVVCPVGCKLSIEKDPQNGYKISGNQCKRGKQYAIEEFTNPTRMLTSTVKMRNSFYRRLPVHSSAPLPKEKIVEAMKFINSVSACPPVKTGDVIIAKVAGTLVDICASRDIEK